MQARLNEVKDLGVATAEEWFKGLEADGKEKAAISALWEQWESAGGFQAMSRNVPEARHSQRPDLEPRHQYSSNETQSTFGPSTIKDNVPSSIKSTAISHPHPWTNQGTHFPTILEPAREGIGFFQD